MRGKLKNGCVVFPPMMLYFHISLETFNDIHITKGFHIQSATIWGGTEASLYIGVAEGGKNKSFFQIQESTMISPPAVVCLLSKFLLKPPPCPYHSWQFVLCLYTRIYSEYPSARAGSIHFRRGCPSADQDVMSAALYCRSISLETTSALMRCRCCC